MTTPLPDNLTDDQGRLKEEVVTLLRQPRPSGQPTHALRPRIAPEGDPLAGAE